MNPDQISAVRKKLRDCCREIRPLMDAFMQRQPMLKGILYQCRRRCGKPNCRCTRGRLHTSTVLAYRGTGKQQNLHPWPEDMVVVGKRTASYQRFRRARVRLVKLFKEVLRLTAILERERLAAGCQEFRRTKTGRRCDELAGH